MKIAFDSIGVSVYVIGDSKIRPSKILSQLKNQDLHFELISPVFLKEFPINFNPERSQILSKRNLSLSDIGCAQAHLNCYVRFLNSKSEFALIFEDDAYLVDSNFTSLFEIADNFTKLSKNQLSGYPVALLYYSESANLIKFNSYFYRVVGNASHALAYIVNREAAIALIQQNMNFDYVPDWPKGTSIKFFKSIANLFHHGSNNGSVESFLELGRNIGKRKLTEKIVIDLKIIFCVTYFSNKSYFRSFKDFLQVLWKPFFQWHFFRVVAFFLPRLGKLIIIRK